MKNQTEAIREHLLSGKKITPLDALNLYGCFRLGARIYDLKRSGMAIKTEIIETQNGKHIAQYSL